MAQPIVPAESQDIPPLKVIPAPDHVSTGVWQQSYYDCTDSSYPIVDAEDLHTAAMVAQSGHGDVAAAKRLIRRRARELGVASPLAEDKPDGDQDGD